MFPRNVIPTQEKQPKKYCTKGAIWKIDIEQVLSIITNNIVGPVF